MKFRYQFAATLGLAALLSAGCNSSNTRTTTQPDTSDQQQQQSLAPAPQPSPAPSVVTTIVLNASSTKALGQFLVDSNGMTLYRYTKDTNASSTCSGSCAALWPPYTVSSPLGLAAAAGINGDISTITRTDGTHQVIYKGTPLYYWSKDKKPGDTTGQNVGGVWFVVKP